jgi:mRNA interferase MazF
MERLPRQGEVIFLAYPFSNLSATKVRPAVVLQPVRKNDMITCQISSKSYADPNAVEIGDDGFAEGGLPMVSYVQTAKLFTAHASLIHRTAGRLREVMLNDIMARVIAVLRGESR